MDEPLLEARSAFADLVGTEDERQGVIATVCDDVALASVLARKGQGAAVVRRAREGFGVDLPHAPRRVSVKALSFLGVAPDAWWVSRPGEATELISVLAAALDNTASVIDQSDGYALLRLTGPKVRDSLVKFVTVDLHPEVFRCGDVATTGASHMSITLSRVQDEPSRAPVFEVAVFRSLAASFWHTLRESAGEYGLLLRRGDRPGASR
jgi:methylglutamate dehydrogenase subunit D